MKASTDLFQACSPAAKHSEKTVHRNLKNISPINLNGLTAVNFRLKPPKSYSENGGKRGAALAPKEIVQLNKNLKNAVTPSRTITPWPGECPVGWKHLDENLKNAVTPSRRHTWPGECPAHQTQWNEKLKISVTASRTATVPDPPTPGSWPPGPRPAPGSRPRNPETDPRPPIPDPCAGSRLLAPGPWPQPPAPGNRGVS